MFDVLLENAEESVVAEVRELVAWFCVIFDVVVGIILHLSWSF